MKEKRMMMMERSTGKTVHDTAGHSRFTLLLLQLLGHDSLYTQSQSLIKHSRVSRELVVPSSVRVTSTTAAAAGQKILQREECCLCVCVLHRQLPRLLLLRLLTVHSLTLFTVRLCVTFD